MNNNTKEIQQNLNRLTTALENNYGLWDYETVAIPFELTQACLQIWTDCFPVSILQKLDGNDEGTLEAWAIALNETLTKQLGILNQWIPLLNVPSIPRSVREKSEQRTAELHQIANEKLAVLKAFPDLFSQEIELRSAAAELSDLRVKFSELQAVEADIQANDLAALRAQVNRKESELLPQQETLTRLRIQQVDLDIQITSLRQQQEVLEQEIEREKLLQEDHQLGLVSQVKRLLNFTENASEGLSISINEAVANLNIQRAEYNLQWEHLQEIIATCKQYYTETEMIRKDLNAHYQVDVNLGKCLPINRHQINKFILAIEENLTELDQELQTVQRQHEMLQQKQHLIFGKS
jgi:hypothetical protein